MYARLEERILARDQIGASRILYDLVRSERPLSEIAGEAVRIHAPYTHVPYHQRLDRGFVRFVNNDHCLLSTRVSVRFPEILPAAWRYLPFAHTIWYIPTGLDPWSQLLGLAPGHYARRTWKPESNRPIPMPTVHWADQKPVYLDGPYEDRLDHWLTLVQRGEVIEAYKVFLGLFEERPHRDQLLAQLAFAGLIDVQDRMLHNRSYTTGHKSYRARATIELGRAIGWEDAHEVIYAGALDMAVGPRWHSAYEMACQVSWLFLADDAHKPVSSQDPSPAVVCEARLRNNGSPLTPAEQSELASALTDSPEPAYIDALTSLLLGGKDPMRILDTMQLTAADLLLETGDGRNFSMPQHCYQYTNTLRWFFETFDHPHRLKLLYVAGSFINQCALWLRNTPGNGKATTEAPHGSDRLGADAILERLSTSMLEVKAAESVAWTRAYLAGGHDRNRLVRRLALGALQHGNDTHNQEIALCILEDYLRDPRPDRDILLLACAQHTAGHMKYGDSLEAYRRFTEALGLSLS
jgi:hypothetical protein